ncbi:Hydroxyproline O-galactosyltransferase GALT5 [Camellia lanceoleosa]|uniref:Hydroxyproline O-galactosyltransferase GALT5 n=1 Tax=Camellia lanceoleosa TaxID=1840588 RepID=A0ACC0IGW4_9ERIC|nr:Hydroxyproline O-galactosyltransferase GALT5 [Camellia lanceoleosa]
MGSEEEMLKSWRREREVASRAYEGWQGSVRTGFSAVTRGFEWFFNGVLSRILKSKKEAFELGKKLWDDLESRKVQNDVKKTTKNRTEPCPNSISLSGLNSQTVEESLFFYVD